MIRSHPLCHLSYRASVVFYRYKVRFYFNLFGFGPGLIWCGITTGAGSGSGNSPSPNLAKKKFGENFPAKSSVSPLNRIFRDGIKGLQLLRGGKLNSTHHGKLHLVYCGTTVHKPQNMRYFLSLDLM